MTRCRRCGVELPPGSLKYVVTIHVTADFDGVLPSGEADMEDLEAFMRQLDAGDAGEMEQDVYQSQAYLLCPACKTAFLDDPLAERPGAPDGDEGGRVH